MRLVRSIMVLSAAVLGAAITMTAQGPPAAPPSTAMTTARTWTDADLDALMKQIGPLSGAVRKSIEAKLPEAEAQADQLEHLFNDVEDFFDAKKWGDAEDVAGEASTYAERMEDAVEARDWDKAAEAAKLVQSTCATCHGKYRDKNADGSFSIKKIQ